MNRDVTLSEAKGAVPAGKDVTLSEAKGAVIAGFAPLSLTRRALLLIAGAALLARRAASQATPAPAPRPAPGDRLYDPSMVQERAAATEADNDPQVKDLEHRLKCTCGCNLDIYTCRTTDFTCSYSPALHREVLALRQAGQSPDQVVAEFVSKYGEKILMAPNPRGFNLTGYLLPGALVALAGLALATLLLRRGRVAAAAAPAAVPAGTLAAPDQERLQRALADVED